MHIYLKATISIKVGTPDLAGLMKFHDFLDFQMEKNATIIVLTSKRRGGAESPITERWNTTSKPHRHVYPMYFQGYTTVQKQPKSAESAKKKQAGPPSKTTKGAPPTSSAATTSHIIAVCCCISIKQHYLDVLDAMAALNNTKGSIFTLEVDPIRSEFLDKSGWITGSHINMNRAHC